jgi:hypothetical protein
MNFKIDLGKIFTGLMTALVIFLAGAIWDFQNLKGRVSATESKLLNIDDKIGIVAKVLCKRAIVENLPDAPEICHDVLKQKQGQ